VPISQILRVPGARDRFIGMSVHKTGPLVSLGSPGRVWTAALGLRMKRPRRRRRQPLALSATTIVCDAFGATLLSFGSCHLAMDPDYLLRWWPTNRSSSYLR
jgi:hypothetical protein